jgi:hypothetical protein
MTFRKSILLLISLTMIAALVACSSSSTSTTPPPPPPPTGPLADGNYVFSLAGFDSVDESQYYVAGSFTVSGGAITGGEQDFVDFDNQLNDQIAATGSSITASADGNLTIVLATSDTTGVVGVAGVETLNGSILPASTADRTLVTEFDASASGSGEIDPQDISGAGAATPAAGYAFAVSGYDQFVENGFPESMGGIINVDGPGTISGTGSVFDANDGYSGSTFAGLGLANTSVVSAPDSSGRVTFTLDSSDPVDFPEIILAGYIVDSTHIRLVETADTYEGTLAGTALSQGANTGTFGTTSVVGGNTYVVAMTGSDTNDAFLQFVGQITPSGSTSAVSGIVDFNDLVLTEVASPDPVTGSSYAVDAAGAGDVTITNLSDGATAFNIQLYLDGNGNALAISMDSTDAIGGFGFMQPTAAVGAFASSNFSGSYGLDVTGWDVNYDGEFDAVGPVSADGTSAITGTVDLNWLNFAVAPATYPAAPVTGTFTANANGVFSDGLTGLDLTDCTLFTSGGAGCSADLFNYYLTGDTAGDTFAIETDLNQITLGYFTQQ